ncbi:MAG: CHC2 zinc finger domain-containing protein [Lachnospiraceae bacterium]|nr:CHC2 zinc finger domain-containing protein [Lachnospiraceae bacterium]
MQNAVDFILQNVKFNDLLDYYNINYNMHGDMIRACCPIHNGTNPTAFVADINKGLYYCHTGCKQGGNIIGFVEKIENIKFRNAIDKISEIMNIDISNMEILNTQKSVDDTKKWIDMMKTKVYKKESEEFDISLFGNLYQINSYRNYSKQTLDKFGVKYCEHATFKTNGKEIFVDNRIIVPIYYNDLLVGATMRSTKKSQIKWLHQPNGIITGNYLYNIDNMQNTLIDGIMLVEGCGDVWNAWQCGYDNAVSSFGSNLTTTQENILTTKTYYVILAYDCDYAGIYANIKAYKMLKDKMKINVANIPLFKDIGCLTQKEFNDVIGNLLSFNEWSKQQHIKDIYEKMTMKEWNKKWT